MTSLKENINNISDDTQDFIRDYIKLFSIKLSEKLARFLGKLSSILIISALILIALVFGSFALAGYLNELLANNYYGYLIVCGIYVLIIVILFLRVTIAKKPLCSNLFSRIISSALEIKTKHPNTLKGLEHESEILIHKIDADMVKIKANFQSLKYELMEAIFSEFFGLFKSKKEKKSDEAEDNDQNIEKENNK